MNNATLYSDFSSMQQNTSEECFREQFKLLISNKQAFDLPAGPSLLDIGCGPGDLLINRILPYFHKQPTKVVGVDISKPMVELANEKYGGKDISFHEFDIQGELAKICEFRKPEGYDFVTSFYCYHWIRDESKALSNIYEMTKTGGILMMVFVANSYVYDVVTEMSRNEKYKSYLSADKLIYCRYSYEKDPVDSFRTKLKHAGFQILNIELQKKIYIHPNLEHLEKTFSALNIFNMPSDVAKDFETDCANRMAEWMTKDDENILNHRLGLISVLARK